MKKIKKTAIVILAIIIIFVVVITIYISKIMTTANKSNMSADNSTKNLMRNVNTNHSGDFSSSNSTIIDEDNQNNSDEDDNLIDSDDSTESVNQDSDADYDDNIENNRESDDSGPISSSTTTAPIVQESAQNSAPLTGPGFMDRNQMKTVASTFINAYYETNDLISRKQTLSQTIDVDYLTQSKTGTLYEDYVVDKAVPYDLINNKVSLLSVDDISIVNAHETSPIVEVKFTYKVKQQADSGSSSQKTQTVWSTYTVSYKIIMGNNYKVRDFKYVKTYFN